MGSTGKGRGKVTKNLSFAKPVIEFTEAYCKGNGRSVSGLVEELLRRYYESKGINVDAPIEEIIATLKKRKAA